MNDEEQKAIDNFKKLDFFEYDWQIEDVDYETREDMLSYAEKMQKIILHLIENQQKEIEELKFNNHMVGKWNEYLDKDCISKDKIREKIKELEGMSISQDIYYADIKEMFEELLEEN